MSRLSRIRLLLSIVLLVPLGAIRAAAQDDPDQMSLGDVARNLRKKTPLTKPVIDDDNLPQVMQQADHHSLSDRFGLWLGFHACDQETYHAMVRGYAERFGLALPPDQMRAEASEWAITRGARSGRVAWQYIQDLAGRQGKRVG